MQQSTQKRNQNNTQPVEGRAIISTNCHVSVPTRVRHMEHIKDRFHLYDEDQVEDATTSPGDALFYMPSARVGGLLSKVPKSSMVSPLLNNVEITYAQIEMASKKIQAILTSLIVAGGIPEEGLNYINPVRTKADLDKLKENAPKFHDLLMHITVFDHAVRFEGVSQVDVIDTQQTRKMFGELQISVIQHGTISCWNSGAVPLLAGDNVYLILPPRDDPKAHGFKKPRFANRAWSITRKAALFTSESYLMKMILDAFADYEKMNGGDLGFTTLELEVNAGKRLIVKSILEDKMKVFFKSSYVGINLSAISDPSYYFTLLRKL